jgi:hypothetical protein
MEFNTLKDKNAIGNREPIITKNARIPLCSSLMGRVSKPTAPPVEIARRVADRTIPNE